MGGPTFLYSEKMNKGTQLLTKRGQTVNLGRFRLERSMLFIWTPEAKKTRPKIQAFTGAPVTGNLFLANNSANRLLNFLCCPIFSEHN
jgi:hypothetical protein